MLLLKFLFITLLPHLMHAASIEARDVVCHYSTPASSGDTCESFAGGWGMSTAEFVALNPGVTCPNLIAGRDYCVIGTVTEPPPPTSTTTTTTTSTTSSTTSATTSSSRSSTSTTSSSKTSTTSTTSRTSTTTTTRTSTTTTAPAGPTNTMPGLAANCNKLYLVVSGDTCDIIRSKNGGISATQFTAWNTFVNSACSNLWLGYYVCVSVPGAVITTSKSTTTTPTPTPPCPSPAMPSIVSNCKKCRMVKSGDTCDVINTAAGITLAQFRNWNKLIDATCSNLWLGYNVCIGV